MSVIKTAENRLADVFKGMPKLSESSKESLAKVWPWIALVFGVIQLAAVWGLWNYLRDYSKAADYLNGFNLYLNGNNGLLTGSEKFVIYLALIALAVDAVLLLMAYSPLKARARRGWDLLFLASLINVVYAVISLFMRGGGASDFLFSLIGSAVGFYLLFQVREKFSRA